MRGEKGEIQNCGGSAMRTQDPRLTQKAMEVQDELFRLNIEAVDLLGLVVAEWESDLMSVQCFDLRIVERSKKVMKQIYKLDPLR